MSSRFLRRTRCWLLSLTLALAMCAGCKTLAPVHVWKPSQVSAAASARVAVAPLAGNPQLASRIEQQLLAQRPQVKSDVQVFTAEQLAMRSPVRLASTAALSSDIAALPAAREIQADLLLVGEILSARLDPQTDLSAAEMEKPVNMNEMFFQRPERPEKHESLVISWRVIDTRDGKNLGTHIFQIDTRKAKQEYPDLEALATDETELLIAASARESWKTLAPVVAEDRIRLARSGVLPGALSVYLGNRAAKRGQWARAERHWSRASRWFPFHASAKHNLALAMAAREDFDSAKLQLAQAQGVFSWSLPDETLFWLDQKHRDYHQAHGLPDPVEGWAFPERAGAEATELISAPPIEMADLPWWTAIPFTKPPGWTWREWLNQPLIF